MRVRNKQAGIAIGPILFIVALLGVLAAAIAAGSGSFNADKTTPELRATAAALIRQAQDIKVGAERLHYLGVSGDDIITYSNPYSASFSTNDSRSIFSPSGGGISLSNYPENALVSMTLYPNQNWTILWGDIWGIGNAASPSAPDLIVAAEVSPSLCLEINRQLHGQAGCWTGANSLGTNHDSGSGNQLRVSAMLHVVTPVSQSSMFSYRPVEAGCFSRTNCSVVPIFVQYLGMSR